MVAKNNNRVIVVVGVSSGIGKAFVMYTLRKRKNDCVILGLGRKNSINVKSKEYNFFKMDLRKLNSVKDAISRIESQYGRIDVLINNAGIGYRGTVEDLSINEIKDQFNVNFFGIIYCIQRVLPIMRRQQSGHIINVSSVAAFVSTPTLGYYSATKSAISKISEVLAYEVRQYNIHLSTFIPAAVDTDFGNNMRNCRKSLSIYLPLYSEWKRRFRGFFKKRVTSEQAAITLWSIIDNKHSEKYMSIYHQIMCLLKTIIPKFFFDILFYNYYYRDEG